MGKLTLSIDNDVIVAAKQALGQGNLSRAVSRFLSHVTDGHDLVEQRMMIGVIEVDLRKLNTQLDDNNSRIFMLKEELRELEDSAALLTTQRGIYLAKLAELKKTVEIQDVRKARNLAVRIFNYHLMRYKGNLDDVRNSPEGAVAIEAMFELGIVNNDDELEKRVEFLRETRRDYFAQYSH